jgi:hypothetical protein
MFPIRRCSFLFPQLLLDAGAPNIDGMAPATNDGTQISRKFSLSIPQQQQHGKLHQPMAMANQMPKSSPQPADANADGGIVHSEFPSVAIAAESVADTLQDAIWRHIVEGAPDHAAFVSLDF